MVNFNFVPCIPDGKNSIEIAKRIKKRCVKKQNKLSNLLKMSLPDFKSQPVSDIKSVDDFPQLTLSQFKRRITLGSFKIRQCRSYIEQIINNGTIYLVNDKQLLRHGLNLTVQNEIKDTKIMACFIISRHKRGKKNKKTESNDVDPRNYTTYYKVFIQYRPIDINDKNEKQYENIKSKSSLPNIFLNLYSLFIQRIHLQLFIWPSNRWLLRHLLQ